MKKGIALTLTGIMALSLAACGGASSSATDTTAETTAASTSSGETEAASSEESDLAYVQSKGTLVVGVTNFEPMDYKDDSGNWVGFDAELATKFAESLGVDVEFQEIDWDNKIMELDGKTIDCVWNGMTLTDEVKSSMSCSEAYCNNAQVVVVKSDVADQYQDKDSIMDLSFAVESGSAGEQVLKDLGISNYTAVSSQADALLEVNSGTSEAAVIDSLMADAMIGEGTDYSDLTYTVKLNSEEYGVGFRKNSDLTEKLNQFFSDCYEDGTMQEIADKYQVSAALIEQ